MHVIDGVGQEDTSASHLDMETKEKGIGEGVNGFFFCLLV